MHRIWLAILVCTGLMLQAKEPKVITAKWSQLPAAIEGRNLKVGLKSGKAIKGRLVGHDDNGLTIDQGRKRGSSTVSRRDIAQVQASRQKRGTKGRAIGAAVGVGTTLALTSLYVAQEDGGGALLPLAVLGIGGGLTLLGYKIGAAVDGSPVHVQIPDLIP